MKLDDVWEDPSWFPDRLDWKNGLIRLVHTSHDIISNSAFLDGRSPLAALPERHMVVDAQAFSRLPFRRPPVRWIFHESFCGSTLLARASAIPGHALCLREPQILVDITNWRLALDVSGDKAFRPVATAVLAKLCQRWTSGERVLIKPSNWVNPIVSDLHDAAYGDRAVVITIGLEEFLIAHLRGGEQRLAFSGSLCRLLCAARPDWARAAEPHLRMHHDRVTRGLQMVTVAHWMQRSMLSPLLHELRSRPEFSFPELLNQFDLTMKSLDRELQLGLPQVTLAMMSEDALSRHSKSGAVVGKDGSEMALNRKLAKEHAAALDQARLLADRLPPLS